jgi:transcription elongation GreA/GreB family factor
MNEELQKVVESGKLSGDAAAKLELLQPGEYCQHRSWGFGRVAEWNVLTGLMIVDFTSKKAHPMQFDYAAQTLSPIPSESVRARASFEPDAVRAQAKEDPAGLACAILKDFHGRATAEQIQSALVPDAMDIVAFRKWWDTAKKKLRADARVHLPAKKNEPVELHDEPVNQSTKLLTSFHEARHPKDQVVAVDAITKSLDDLIDEVAELTRLCAGLDESARKGQKLHTVQAIELLLARDEIVSRHKALEVGENAPAVADFLKSEQWRLAEIFTTLPASKHRKTLAHFPVAFAENWQEKALQLALKATSPRLVQEIARLFDELGEKQAFADALNKIIRERSASPEMLLWLCKERGAGYPGIFNIDLFGAVLTSLEQDMLSDITRGTRLNDLVMDDKTLLADLFKEATLVEVRDAVRKLKLTTVFDDLNKRSLLGRIIKMHPETASMITGEQQENRDESVVVSWASLERRRLEYEDLVNRQIPQNIRDISIARSYGDLRENFEFKSAKEQQGVLQRKQAEMQRELALARGTNFDDVDVSKVSIGSIVTLIDVSTSEKEVYSILGAWDSVPEKGIVSYKAAIGQALLGHAPGEIVELPTEHGLRQVKIESISAFKELELLGETPDSSN